MFNRVIKKKTKVTRFLLRHGVVLGAPRVG